MFTVKSSGECVRKCPVGSPFVSGFECYSDTEISGKFYKVEGGKLVVVDTCNEVKFVDERYDNITKRCADNCLDHPFRKLVKSDKSECVEKCEASEGV